jgi:hypothetical protein
MPLLKQLIWVYFLLLIFEGALRKWILPQLSAPLLIVRDPVSFLIIWEAFRTNKWPRQWSAVTALLTFAIFALFILQIVAGDTPVAIEIFGLRSYLLPFPVAFIIGSNLDEEDLRKFGLCTLWILAPMVCLEVAQYLSPSTSFWNRAASRGATQIGYAGSHVRASGTFSFVTGMAGFVAISTVFVFHGLANQKFAKRWLLVAAGGALILAVPITGSRGMVLGMLEILVFAIIAAMFGISQLVASVRIIVLLLIVSALVIQLPIFSQSMQTFQDRLQKGAGNSADVAAGTTRGFLWRLNGAYDEFIDGIYNAPHWYGHGIGLGSTVASSLLAYSPAFMGGENILGRTIFEFGPPLGLAFILFRIVLGIIVAVWAFERMREGHILAWLLVPSLLNDMVWGVLEQPTAQGFFVMGLGFSLAALNRARSAVELPDIGSLRPLPRHYTRPWGRPLIRGPLNGRVRRDLESRDGHI